jgi:RNA polymerase sigma-70 factor (ECF subfamily)
VNQESIDQLWQARESVYRVAYNYVRNETDALEIVSETYAKAVAKIDSLANPEFAKTWLIRIAINTSLDVLRKRKDHLSLVEIESTGIADSQQSLQIQLMSLPIEIRTVLALRFYEDMKLQEISDLLDIPLSTVKYRLYNGLSVLRIQIDNEESELA